MPLLLTSLAYVAIGLVSAALANAHGPGPVRMAWRLGAWGASAAVFAAQVWHEHARRHSAPRTTALHAALAVALAGFALALNVVFRHAGAPGQGAARGLALVLWPLLGGLPSYGVAFVLAALLARTRPAR